MCGTISTHMQAGFPIFILQRSSFFFARMSCSEQNPLHGQASDRVWSFSELLFQNVKREKRKERKKGTCGFQLNFKNAILGRKISRRWELTRFLVSSSFLFSLFYPAFHGVRLTHEFRCSTVTVRRAREKEGNLIQYFEFNMGHQDNFLIYNADREMLSTGAQRGEFGE